MAASNKSPEYHYYIAKICSYDGPIRCDICPNMQTYSRKQCELTGEYLGDTRRTGHLCPLIPISAEEWFEIEKFRYKEEQPNGYSGFDFG